ncbi:MAG: NrtR-regulated NrtX [Cellvibrionaceae bacterium]|nr:NrtR-regulated NrtX [Cellvibrionaceae bacterium]
MFGLRYFKADSTTYAIKTVNGTIKRQGKGISFFYNSATTSISTVAVGTQEAPFIFNLQTADFQALSVQGQVSFRIADPLRAAELLNFNLQQDGLSYVSEDPLKIGDRVVRTVQSIVQNRVQSETLRAALSLNQALVSLLQAALRESPTLAAQGIEVLDVSVAAIKPSTETARALEAEAREMLLKEADDAIYARRKFAVEQERTIKEAELQTELSVQEKQQEIHESRIANQRTLLRGEMETAREKRQGEIDAEAQRRELVSLSAENTQKQADAEAYAIKARMAAFTTLPVENLKAMALANMEPEQMMAQAFESLAQNADKIGELTITPDLFGKLMKPRRS